MKCKSNIWFYVFKRQQNMCKIIVLIIILCGLITYYYLNPFFHYFCPCNINAKNKQKVFFNLDSLKNEQIVTATLDFVQVYSAFVIGKFF